MLKVSELYIYPIKSLAGIKLNRAEVTDRGFKHDRRWMLIDENNRFLSQREVALMALLKVSIEDAGVTVTFNKTSIQIPFDFENQEFISVEIWDDTCRAQLIDKNIDKWFSDILGINCRLVYMPDESLRVTDPRYAPAGSVTSFADAYPFLLIGQASLDDLNSRLDVAIPMDRFRPNIVITGSEPYQEDLIDEITINGISFSGVKLCARCNIPTIDQQTARASKEPSKTMAKYRLKNKKIYFGQNLIHSATGLINVGDEVTILSKHTEDRFIV
ncbi:MOSC domain-containing protein [Mucilaginibacter calamicampi]|uniref:MOSC domain-containing protein n=1 Tax=Mucilaginibacter calamicampi TaxID=1302352 RepID=A0ABW2YTX3_9SPHI